MRDVLELGEITIPKIGPYLKNEVPYQVPQISAEEYAASIEHADRLQRQLFDAPLVQKMQNNNAGILRRTAVTAAGITAALLTISHFRNPSQSSVQDCLDDLNNYHVVASDLKDGYQGMQLKLFDKTNQRDFIDSKTVNSGDYYKALAMQTNLTELASKRRKPNMQNQAVIPN